MMNSSRELLMVADFETTVYDGQTETEVWAAGYATLFHEGVTIVGSMDKFIKNLTRMNKKIKCWFHNLKFDGNFIISYLLRTGYKWNNTHDSSMPPKSFKALISTKNRFYSISIKTTKNNIIELWDSVKLIPFSLDKASEAFNTEHKKLTIEYKGMRYENCPITIEEKAYIENDVLVLKEIMEILVNRNMNRMTIGSVCMKEFKDSYDKWEWKSLFPDLRNIPAEYGELSTEQYVRKTYKGAWCYLKKDGWYNRGKTYDVNSLYPSIMHSESGNFYPVGQPHYFKKEIPDICKRKDIVWFIHLKCRFELKEGFFPTVQIKNSFLYPANEWLKTSKFNVRGKFYDTLVDRNGNTHDSLTELYLTFKDYELLCKHYNLYDLEILDGCWFTGMLGLFDDYINHWMSLKINTDDEVERTIDKLYLNNLYGKFASSDDDSYMVPELGEDEVVHYTPVESHDKDVIYIPVGSMITSYARYFTITHAQKNYDLFIYADTDSIHMMEGEAVDIKEHKTNLLCWKKESVWCRGKFIRQKTYAECVENKKIKGDNFILYDWNITCAGMPKKSKEIFLKEHKIEDFKYGLRLKGKLVPKIIKGGVILQESEYTLRPRK